jgi:hypothetical protein
VAAIVLSAWSHAGRCRTDAAFAMLGGAAPIPASSGQTVRVRLNRSGDRQLNQALHLVVLTRLGYDPATRADAQRRRAQVRPTGKSDAVWSAMLPASSTDSWRPTHPLTQHRSVRQHDHQSKQTVETHTMRQTSLCPGKRPPAAATRVRHDPSSGVVAVTGSRCR